MSEGTGKPQSPSLDSEEEGDMCFLDHEFYFRIVVFRAEYTLFKVPTYAFPADEGLFASMFLLPKGDGEHEGSSDKNPIRLPSEVSAFDFKSLLKVCLPKPKRVSHKLTIDEWMSALKLSTMWCLDDIRATCVDEASAAVTALGPIEKLVLAKRYSVSKWFIEAVEALAKRGNMLSAEEIRKIGLQTSVDINQLREQSWSWASSPSRQGGRLHYSFLGSIHVIFKDELTLDKDYSAPKIVKKPIGTPVM